MNLVKIVDKTGCLLIARRHVNTAYYFKRIFTVKYHRMCISNSGYHDMFHRCLCHCIMTTVIHYC